MAKVSPAALNAATNIAFTLNDLINVIPENETGTQLSALLAKLYRDACFAVDAKAEAGQFTEFVELFTKQAAPPAPPVPAVGRQAFRPVAPLDAPRLDYATVPVGEYTDDMRELAAAGEAKPAVVADPDMINVILQTMKPQLEARAEAKFQALVKQHGLRPTGDLQPKCARL